MNVELAPHPVDQHFKVELAHSAYDGLAGRFDPTIKLQKLLSEKIGLCQDPEITEKVMDEVNGIEAVRKLTVEDYTDLLKKHFDHEVTN